MNTAFKPSSSEVTVSTPRELLYTICPVLVASNVSLELGWIDDELARVGATAAYLRSFEGEAVWKAHYDHSSERLLRDGGNSPAVWAQADLRPTVLVGLTQAQPAGKIIVRADDDIYRLADLKSRRFGIYKSLKSEKIDHRRATTEHGILAALALHGLKRSDVEWVDVEDKDSHRETPARTPAGIWAQRHAEVDAIVAGAHSREARALLEGRIDALYDYSIGTSRLLETSGRFKVIEDLDRYPDWTLRVANAPRTITISKEFADANRDVVVAWLRASIRAGRWINANRDAAAEVFYRTTIYQHAGEIAKALRNYDLVPNLSAQNLAGLTIEKNFLLSHGYIRNDFDVSAWADASYLEEALASL
ncbi:ABC transporter substrate-binding protein [Mesorhizobium sp. DCY119]|uniref:ABC transporter substrate-binding protein n=1 Tax=Mesorhizobium sp. DCY119 TaxID=2108445 RepID=UPI000E7121CF|nr:ABC transporter substrate-binding protein [Mesorhizobium sp. DCY119]RJG40503.1 ABC transporter substrate-binding protein [Mesorhizobium sp. DCY119]